MNRSVIPPADALIRARAVQPAWWQAGLPARLRVLARLRTALAADAAALAATVPQRPPADTLVAELLPLAEACAFLLRAAPGLLAPRALRRGRPRWLLGVRAELRREPVGAVLVLAPGNYPLFLPGVQAVQALCAGNAVCVKPAPGQAAPMEALAALLRRAGVPDGAFQVLDDGADTGAEAVDAGFDKIVLTGSATTGTHVLRAAARTLTPVVAELSGADAVFVLPGADLARLARALCYGLRLNGGATCIAPRRVFVPTGLAGALETALRAGTAGLPPAHVPPQILTRLDALLNDAEAAGARVLSRPGPAGCPPVLVVDAGPAMRLLQEDVFAPWLALVPVQDTQAALDAARHCPYALGASVWGPEADALALAARVRAGSVCVNDLIVPTADPRLPFAGRGRSGFGATRGAEGLLEMTVPKAVSIRRGRFLPHLDPPRPDDAERFAALVGLLHGDWRTKLAGLRTLARTR